MPENKVHEGGELIVNVIYVAILLGVLLLAVVIVIGAVGTANTNLNGATLNSSSAVNESHYMNGSIGYYDLNVHDLTGVTCTIPTNGIVNLTDNKVIAHGNWTQSNCRIVLVTSAFNNTYWNNTYTYTWDVTNTTVLSTGLTSITSDVTGLVNNFFALMPTVGTVLAVIILIGGIVILVLYVRKMKGETSNEGYTG